MFKASVFAAAIVTLCFTSTSHSETVRIDCAYGEMTISRITDGECSERIPLPTPRPETVAAKEVLPAVPKKPLVKPEYFEFTTDSGETKIIRLVGPRFLPENQIDLRAHASNHPKGSAFSRAVAYFGLGEWGTDVLVQEARAELTVESLSN